MELKNMGASRKRDRATHERGQSSLSPPSVGIPCAVHAREILVQRVIMAILSASVPHESLIPGGLESRSLGYYLGVGIDHLNHDFGRREILLRRAAEQAIAAIAQAHGREQ